MKNIHVINGEKYELVYGCNCIECAFYYDSDLCHTAPDCDVGYFVKIQEERIPKIKKASQNKRILKYLLTGKRLTSIEALKLFNCLRLSARINNLRKYHTISDAWINTTSGKRIKEYFIEK